MSTDDTASDQMAAAISLDLRGQRCPATTGETVKALNQLQVGEILEVVSDYYPARSTIPYHCDKRGYPFWMTEPDAAGRWSVRIEKKEGV